MKEQDYYNRNHFEIHIDGDDNLRLNCRSVCVQYGECTTMHVDFYLSDQTDFILHRDFSSNTHSVKLILYKSDMSSCETLFDGTCDVKSVKCLLDGHDSSVCLVTVVFRSVAA